MISDPITVLIRERSLFMIREGEGIGGGGYPFLD